MARRLKKVDGRAFEALINDSLKRVGANTLDGGKVALFSRLLFSGVANYFFQSPDDLVEIGFLKFKKNPDKNELFAVEITKNEEAGVINADTLYRYYTGELASEKALQKTMDNFVNELLTYSQEQNNSISELTGKLKKRRN